MRLPLAQREGTASKLRYTQDMVHRDVPLACAYERHCNGLQNPDRPFGVTYALVSARY
jgi:hypothetical protein